MALTTRRTLVIGALLLPMQAIASPWIGTESAQLRHSVEVLVNYNVIKRPVNTYPLMWKGIISDLHAVPVHTLEPQAQFAYYHLQHALKFAKQDSSSKVRAFANSKPETWQGFGPRNRAKSGIETSGQITGKTVSAKVSVNYRDDALDGKYVDYDGSYLAALLGNWSLSAEKITHWWGPSQENPLVLSNNAQAMKAVRLTRHDSGYEGPSWLSFIGPWSFTALGAKQQNQINKIADVKVEDGDFWGWRFSSTPIQGLEVGLSQTHSDWLHFPVDTITVAVADEQKLSAIDFKYSSTLGSWPVAIYAEYAGHVESALVAEDGAFTLGVQSHYGTSESLLTSYLEYTDTQSQCINQAPDYNCNYGNIEVAQGYQHREQNLGPTIGSNSEAVTWGTYYHRVGGYAGHIKLGHIKNNDTDLDITRLELGYQQGVFGMLVQLTGHIWQEETTSSSDTHTALSLALEHRF
ncbi:capsule assembly Wzi family protein [Pseudoalteromonas sp. SSDWG2]|uniref:capsule assembly Wzi family protein n=1 Tax=Pseudoalteromonas sp. SSDWG2 TaxID=3139391 RepID=UPI003BAADB1A